MLNFEIRKYPLLSTAILLVTFVTACAHKTPQSTANNVNKAICKKYMPTNSRIPIKDCRTQAEWDEVKRRAQNSLDASTRPQTNNPREGI